MENPALIQETKEQIIEKLLGKYGCKRFLRDGYQTIKEVSESVHVLYFVCGVTDKYEGEKEWKRE